MRGYGSGRCLKVPVVAGRQQGADIQFASKNPDEKGFLAPVDDSPVKDIAGANAEK